MNDVKRSCSKDQFVHYQLGAPALIYHPKHPTDQNHNIPIFQARPNTIDSTQRKINRTKFLWNIPYDVEERKKRRRSGIKIAKEKDRIGGYQLTKNYRVRTGKRGTAKGEMLKFRSLDQKTDKFDHLYDVECEYRKRREQNPKLQNARKALLLKMSEYKGKSSEDESILMDEEGFTTIDDYTTFDYPYIPGYFGAGSKSKQLLLDAEKTAETRNFSLDRQLMDPAYLAPFGIDALEESREVNRKNDSIDNTMLSEISPARDPQGNCLVVFACPCKPCGEKFTEPPSVCLFHPKGPTMDRVCISNIIPPNGHMNAGHVLTKDILTKTRISLRDAAKGIFNEFPNEICLGDTILELKQSGTWANDDDSNPQCTFVARTATFISVLRVTVKNATYGSKKEYHYDADVCWGNYVIQERKRIDLRSLSPFIPSYRPTSIACHQEYGNECTDSKFAFTTCTDQGEFHAIRHCIPQANLHLMEHPIPSLRHISMIEFTRSHPMCLWSAAASFVRPALSKDLQFKQPTLGMGTSLYTIDMRDNSAIFQWSPSAEEMVTEGVHSISCVVTDWQRDHVVFVSSKSAGKTWEIDARMPCRAANVWSLSYACEDSSLVIPRKAIFREGRSLFVKTLDTTFRGLGAPFVTVDTAPGSYGFHVLQQPLNRPRFHTDTMQCIATPGLDFSEHSSIATSSVFAYPETSNDVYPCGIAAFRLPFTQFGTYNYFSDITDETANVICSLTMTNRGDLFCHSLLESKEAISDFLDSADLSIGVKAISIPNELEGKVKLLDHKHWKSTGGMDLKLYLTNHYPIIQSAICSREKNLTKYLHIAKSWERGTAPKQEGKWTKRARKAMSLDQDCDDPLHIHEFDRETTEIIISTNSKLSENDPVALPLAIIEKANKDNNFFDKDEKKDRCVHDTQISDLSSDLIKKSSLLWYELNSDPEEEGTI
jgi:hypothetical protein